jgi:hypothetical protein
MRSLPFRIACLLALAATSLPAAEPAAATEPDNGTDPSKLNTSATTQWEHLELRNGFTSDTIAANYTQPIEGWGRTSLRLRVPAVRATALGRDSFGLGDVSLKGTHVAELNRTYALVFTGELAFDTAARTELGTGQNVLKPAIIYAKFLKDGSIFAPAMVHSVSLWGEDSRAEVNSTVFDFYYVPKLSTKKVFITFDPALSVDWENEREFLSLAVTFGFPLGPLLGGNSQIFVKPSVFAGGERPSDWGMEIGFKVIGF